MNVYEAWNKFINSGSVYNYLEYLKIEKTGDCKNAKNNQGVGNKGDGHTR